MTKTAQPARECSICGQRRPRGEYGIHWYMDPPTCGSWHCENFAECGNFVVADRIHARFCSARCRSRVWRREYAAR